MVIILERKVLIIDDNKVYEETLAAYERIFNELKSINDIQYNITFSYETSINSALKKLDQKNETFDVVLIDYKFADDTEGRNGSEIIKIIRSNINKKCQIIFYTMQNLSTIEKESLVDLINNNVFRFISKSGDFGVLKYKAVGREPDQLIVEAIIDALTNSNSEPFSSALERYLIRYASILDDLKIDIDGKSYGLEQVIDSIRRDQEPGNTFINNLIEMSIIKQLVID